VLPKTFYGNNSFLVYLGIQRAKVVVMPRLSIHHCLP